MSFSITGVAFQAISTETIDRTTDELRNEQIVTKEMEKTASNIGYMTTEKNNLVAFNDPVSGKLAVVSLSSTTMDKLKAHFGENDFYQQKDGITRLDNKAESFVGGWFGDIAYKREFLSADQNQDGKLDSNEYLNTRNEFNGHAEEVFSNGIVLSSHEMIDEAYQKVSLSKVKGSVSYSVNKDKVPNSIDEELNDTLNNDKNFDSQISLRESYSQASFMSDEKMIKTHIEEYRKTHLNYGYENNKLIPMEIESKKQQALAKLMQNNGDVSKLSAEERNLLAGELSQYKKKDGTHTVNMDILKKLDKQLKDESDINVKLDKVLTKVLDESLTRKSEVNTNMRDKQSKKTIAIGMLIKNDGEISKLSKEDYSLIKDEIEHSKDKNGNIDTDKLKQIQEYQRAKENYTAPNVQASKLYVQKG
ncbi:MAG: hypothetical protein WC667_11150 [Sulfurimonas sp.]